jgi:hypothetical protein
MTLRPVDATVAVKMGDGQPLGGISIETGFQLSTIHLGAEGRLETLRLIPTQQPPGLALGESSFAIGGLSVQPANAHQNLQLTAPADHSMRVRLTAPFELLTVELSPRFEIAAVLLQSRSTNVVVSNSAESAGTSFYLHAVELDSAAQLRRLLVRAIA